MIRILLWVLLAVGFTGVVRAQTNAPPTFKMDGEASLMTNYVEYGISQTNKDPALQGAFWFNWGPQFRLGLWGSNVHYSGEDSHFLLKLNADLKIVFSPNANVIFRFSDNHYFKPGTHNGNTIGLHFQIFDYKVIYEQLSNFLGTETTATYFAFGTYWNVFQTWKWDNQVGYMQTTSSTLNNYFDLRSFIGTKPSAILYQIGGTYNSAANQFNGLGDLAIILMATVGF